MIEISDDACKEIFKMSYEIGKTAPIIRLKATPNGDC